MLRPLTAAQEAAALETAWALAHLSDGKIQGLIRYEALPEDRLLNFSTFTA